MRGHITETPAQTEWSRPRRQQPVDAAAGSRRLRIGVASSLSGGEGRRLIARIIAARSAPGLNVRDGDEIVLATGLERGAFDVIIAPDGVLRRGWCSLPLFSAPLAAVLRIGHPLADGAAVSAAALRSETLLLAGDGVGDRAFRRTVFQALDGMPARVVHHDVQRDTLLELVAVGLGVTVLPRHSQSECFPGVMTRPVKGEHVRLTYALMWREADGESAVRSLLRGLADGDRL